MEKKDTFKFHTRLMSSNDIPFAVSLTDTVNWNLCEEDFKFIMKLEPQGCFTLINDSETVGIITTICYGKAGWVGNLIVNETYRKKGGGSILLNQAIKYLKNKEVKTIGLYCRFDRIPFYKKRGFSYDSDFLVMKREKKTGRTNSKIEKYDKKDLNDIIKFDNFYFGSSRRKLLESIINEKNNYCIKIIEKQEIVAYGMVKSYGENSEIGPLICIESRQDVVIRLIKNALDNLGKNTIYVYIPKKEIDIINFLISSGFIKSFSVARMFQGPSLIRNCIYLAESLERG